MQLMQLVTRTVVSHANLAGIGMTWYDNMMQMVDVGVSTGSKEDAFPRQNHDVLCGFGGATVSQQWKSPMVLRAGFKSLFVRRFGGCLTDG